MAGVIAAFMSLQSGGFLPAVGCILVGVMGFLSFTSAAELIEMAISARDDLGDVRFYLSSMSKPKPEASETNKLDDARSYRESISHSEPESQETDE